MNWELSASVQFALKELELLVWIVVFYLSAFYVNGQLSGLLLLLFICPLVSKFTPEKSLFVFFFVFLAFANKSHISSVKLTQEVHFKTEILFHSERMQLEDKIGSKIEFRNLRYGCIRGKIYKIQDRYFSVACEEYLSFVSRINTFLSRRSKWVQVYFFGKKDLIDHDLYQLLLDFSLYHMFVVSGMHFFLIFKIVSVLLIFPFQLMYGLGLLSPFQRIKITIFKDFFLNLILYFYMSLLGSFPAQRAFLFILINTLSSYIHTNSKSKFPIIPIVAVVQILFFPVGVLDYSMLFTWVFYLLVNYKWNGFFWGSFFRLYIALVLSNILFFGKVNLVGVAVSFLIMPILIFVFTLSFLNLTTLIENKILDYFGDYFINLIEVIYSHLGKCRYLNFEIEPLNHDVKIFLGLSFILHVLLRHSDAQNPES